MSGLASLGAAELALRLQPLSAANAFVAVIAPAEIIESVVEEIAGELRYLEPEAIITASSGKLSVQQLLTTNRERPAGAMIARADRFGAEEWATLDRLRSDLAREGVTVVVTTESSFAQLARWVM